MCWVFGPLTGPSSPLEQDRSSSARQVTLAEKLFQACLGKACEELGDHMLGSLGPRCAFWHGNRLHVDPSLFTVAEIGASHTNQRHNSIASFNEVSLNQLWLKATKAIPPG